MHKPTYQERVQQLYIQRCGDLVHKFLGCYLVRVSDNDVEAYETTDGGWLFTKTDEPVFGRRSIGQPNPKPLPNLFKWKIERAELTYASHWEPEQIDFAELEGLHDSLLDAIEEAIALQHRDEVKNFQEGQYWEHQNTLVQEYDDEILESITSK